MILYIISDFPTTFYNENIVQVLFSRALYFANFTDYLLILENSMDFLVALVSFPCEGQFMKMHNITFIHNS